MIQQLKDKLEETKQSLQHQLKVNTQLHVEGIFKGDWSLWFNYLASCRNEVVPIVIKLTKFEKYKYGQYFDSAGFYTKDSGYKMYLSIFPKGCSTHGYVEVGTYLMKGDHDDHLPWPVKGTLTVQLLNQLGDNNHGEPVKLLNGSGSACQRVTTGTKSTYGIWSYRFMSHKKLSYNAIKKCQYLKDDCLFFRVSIIS